MNKNCNWKSSEPMDILLNHQNVENNMLSTSLANNNFEKFSNPCKSWSFSSNFEYTRKSKYSPITPVPLKERRKFLLSPLSTKTPEEKHFKTNFEINNVIKVPESRNVTKLVLVKKEQTEGCIIIKERNT